MAESYSAAVLVVDDEPADLAATVYHCLGVDPHMQIYDRLGKPATLCEGTPIQAIL